MMGVDVRKFFISLVIYVFAPVFIGAILYYIFCPDVYFVNKIDEIFGLYGCHIFVPISNIFIKFLRYYLMDFLWSFSLMAIVWIVFYDLGINKLILAVIGFEVVMELIQLFPRVIGAFDIYDIVVEIIANILVIYLLSKRRETNAKI